MTDIRVLLYLLRSDTTSLAWAKERMIEAADEIERLRAQLAYFGKLHGEENERQSNRIADIVERLREQWAERYKEEQAPDVICGYERERLEAADEIERLCEQLAYFGKLANEENERQSNRIAELLTALGGLILHVEERDHYEECFGEAAEMKIARKAYQAAAVRGENK